MSNSNSRHIKRRDGERRTQNRRLIYFAFGSDAWIHAIQSTYLFWPKQERRKQERRSISRRLLERRQEVKKYRRRAIQRSNSNQYQLTVEERAMLREVMHESKTKIEKS